MAVTSGGGTLAVIGVGAVVGTASGVAGAIAGDVTRQMVTSMRNKQTLSQAISNVSIDNFSDKAKNGTVGG